MKTQRHIFAGAFALLFWASSFSTGFSQEPQKIGNSPKTKEESRIKAGPAPFGDFEKIFVQQGDGTFKKISSNDLQKVYWGESWVKSVSEKLEEFIISKATQLLAQVIRIKNEFNKSHPDVRVKGFSINAGVISVYFEFKK